MTIAAALGLDAEFFEPEVLDITDDADGGDQPVGLDLSACRPYAVFHRGR